MSSDSQWLHSDVSSFWRYYETALKWKTDARANLESATDYYDQNNYGDINVSQEDIDSVNKTTNLIRQMSSEFAENLVYSNLDEEEEGCYEDEYEYDEEEDEEMEVDGHVMGNEEDWTPEMAEFVRKTREHRQQLAETRAKTEPEKVKQTMEWVEKDIDDYVMADDIGVHGVQKASTSAPTHNEEAEKHKAELNKMYGTAAEKIEQLEIQIHLKFEEVHKKSVATLWPNIPLRF